MGMNVNGNYPVYDNNGSNIGSTKSTSSSVEDSGKKQSWLSRIFKGKNMATREKQLNNLHSKLDYLEEQLQGASGEKAEKLEKKKEKLEKKIEKKEAKKEKYEEKIENKINKLEEKLEKADGKKAERLEKKIGKLENELDGSSSKKSNAAGETASSGPASGKTSGSGNIEQMGKFDNDKEGGQYTNNEVFNDWKNMDDAAFNEKYAKEGVLTASETYTPESIRSLLNKMSNSEAGKVLLKEDFGIDNPDKLSKMSDKDIVKKFYDCHKKAADSQAKEGGKGGGAAATAFDTAGLKANPPYFRQLTIYQGKENHVMTANASEMTDNPEQARGMSPDMLY